jgi:hypothetical protein
MFPMANTGFFKRQGGGGFRYLHDEISGGVMALSHLKCLEAYAGDCANVNSIDYGFNGDNFFDNPLLSGTAGTGADVAAIYDQTENINAGPNGNSYNYDNQDWAYNGIRRNTSNLSSSDDIFTFVAVYNPLLSTRSQRNETRVLGTSVGAGQQGLTIWYETNGDIVIRLRDAIIVNTIITYSGVLSGDDIYLIAVDYDGLGLNTSFNLYVNDMITPLTPTSATGAPKSVFTQAGTNYPFFNGDQDGTEGAMFDAHYWNKVLSQAERETAKEILEQYYTF